MAEGKRYQIKDWLKHDSLIAEFDTEEEGIFWLVNHGYEYTSGNSWRHPDDDHPQPLVFLTYQGLKTVEKMVKAGTLDELVIHKAWRRN